MICVFQANSSLLEQMGKIENERTLITLVMENLAQFQLATRVKHGELDIAFAATGGPSNWINVDNMKVGFEPIPERQSVFGDILVEMSNGYVNLSTPAGFIPLVDVVEMNGDLSRKQLN